MADAYVVKIEKGYARLYKTDGSFVRHVCAGAISAEIYGNEIHVTINGNKTRIFSVKGFYIITIEKSVTNGPAPLLFPH